MINHGRHAGAHIADRIGLDDSGIADDLARRAVGDQAPLCRTAIRVQTLSTTFMRCSIITMVMAWPASS